MDADHTDDDGLEVLSDEECWKLLRSHSIGRFATNRTGASPLVVPVNYIVDADASIVFRSGAGAKLDHATRGLVAMQVDELDPLHQVGWSVIAEGTARWLYEEQDGARIESWAPGARPYVVRLTPTGVSGRRIRLVQLETDSRGYR